MSHEAIFKAAIETIPLFENDEKWRIKGYSRIDPHTISMTLANGLTVIFTYYGPRSWKLETK